MDTIQRGYQYHRLPIDKATRKSDLSAMILHGNQKSAKINLNVTDLERVMGKEVEYGWDLPTTIESVRHINNAGDVPLGVAEHF